MQGKLLVVLLFALAASSLADDCETPGFQDFCKEVVTSAPDHQVDHIINEVVSDIETALSYIWSSWTNRLNNIASRHGFSVCNDCITALKHSLCSSLVPSCGFSSCIASVASEIGSQCFDESNGNAGSQCASVCANSLNSTSQMTECTLCEINCVASIISVDCSDFMMSRQMCSQLLETCACNSQQADINVVCEYFSESGYTIPFPSGLSCDSTPGWCGAHNKRSSTPQSAGVMFINQYVQLALPQATGMSLVTDPLISNDTPGELSSELLSSSNANIIAISIAVIAALLILF